MPRKPTPEQLLALPREDYLRAKIVALDKFLGSTKANGQALVNGTRLATQLRAELDELVAPKATTAEDPTAGLTDAQVVSAMVEALRALPVHVLDDVLDGIEAERIPRGAPSLVVVDGGGT